MSDETDPHTFVCSECQLETPNSEGAADDMPEVCDTCWCKAHGIKVESDGEEQAND